MNDRQLAATVKIDSIKDAIKQMNEGKDISNIAKRLLYQELNQLKLQVENINLDSELPDK